MAPRTERGAGRRVVVVGSGVISPVGTTTAVFWDAITAGRSGIAPISGFDATALPTRIAAEVRDFDPDLYMPPKSSRRLDRFTQFAVAAALQALEEAKLSIDHRLAPRTGVLIGSAYGPTRLIQQATLALRERGPRSVGPYFAATASTEMAAAEVALRLGAQGPSGAAVTACATGATCIGEAMRTIQRGEADVMLAGGSDDAVTPLDVAAAAYAGSLSRRNDEPERASRPFDRDRDGFVMGAGAGVVVLEDAGHAVRRGAPVLAELAGYGASTDAHHMTAPHPDGAGARRAMQLALADAGIHPSEVGYVNAHGTSTVLNDRIESRTIRAVLGERASKVPISSTKSMIGHLLGAAGAVELIATVLALRSGCIPPTVNCDHPEDPGLNYVPNRAQAGSPRVAVSNSFGFGGHNAVLVVRRWEEETEG